MPEKGTGPTAAGLAAAAEAAAFQLSGKLRIAYEDEELLVAEKPAGMLVHPTVKMERLNLCGLVQTYYEQAHLPLGVHPVSRLDRFTSGLVLFAKDPHAQAKLAATSVKEYLALAVGTFPKAHGIIDAPIARRPGSIVERQVDYEQGRAAVTEYWVLGQHQELNLVRVRLHTGRTHQIRVHFAFIGCPLWQDHLYGTPGPASRHGLHAYKLILVHPVSGRRLEITSDLPRDLQQALYPY